MKHMEFSQRLAKLCGRRAQAARLAAVAMVCTLALALAGCAGMQGTTQEEADAAAANRQYMAQLNKQMADLQQVMDDFQVAVSEGNAVAMKAQVQKAEGIIAQIESGDATDSLADAKDKYVDALSTLDDAMKDYANLYAQVESSGISGDDLASRMEKVQAAYDEGVAKLQEADDAVAALAQG